MCASACTDLIFILVFFGTLACFISTSIFVFDTSNKPGGYYSKVINNNKYKKISAYIKEVDQSYYDCCSNFYDCKCQYEHGQPNCYYNYDNHISGRCTDYNMICGSERNRYSINYGSCTLNCGICSNISITFTYNNFIISFNKKCEINDQSCFNKYHANEYAPLYINKYNEVLEELYVCDSKCIAAFCFLPISFIILIFYIYIFYRMCECDEY